MKIREILSNKDKIDLNPQWQRGPVWSPARRSLLIDSILRDMDIPKIYLLHCPPGAAFTYEAVDGQQRLRAIFDFADDKFELRHTTALPAIDGIDIAGHSISSLNKRLVRRFDTFQISVAEIASADHDQVRQLFLRLQMGVALNPAELRNAIGGPIRNMIDAMALAHPFFIESKIGPDRYKHQDYLAHVFTYAETDGLADVKAPNIRHLYDKFESGQTDAILDLFNNIGRALDVLSEVNRLTRHRITQKWIFVDLFWLIYSFQRRGETVGANTLAVKYEAFDDRRKIYIKTPEILLDKNRTDIRPSDEALYSYIQAFRASGGDRENLQIRRRALRAIVGNIGGG